MSLEEPVIKRARVPNFTVEEKTILINLVNKRKEIIESKYTDTKSIIKKKEAWMLIEKEFNSEINVYKRDHTVLKRAWDNLKAQTRKMRASRGDDNTKSGGSSPVQAQAPPPQKQSVINMVLEPIPTLTGEVDNDFDSDGIVYKSISTDQNDQSTSSVQISGIEFESNDSSHMKFEDSNDESCDNPHTIRNNDFIQREADLRLQSLQKKNKLEQQILKTKLQTALLHQQTAKIHLEAAKLELAYQKKRMKD